MARLRSAPGSQVAATKAPGTRRALKEKTNTTNTTKTRAKAPVYSDDGNTECLIKDAKPKRGRPKRYQQDEEELVMAGGLGLVSDRNASQNSEAASDSVPRPPPTTNRRPPRATKKVAPSEASTKVLEGLKKRMAATAEGQRAKPGAKTIASDDVATSSDPLQLKKSQRVSTNANTERSEFSLTPSPPPPGRLSTVKGNRTSIMQPGSVMKMQNTPLVESSIIALKNFKRRPRQPSMLQMVQQRTASARPSLANATTLTVDDNAFDNSSLSDLDLGLDLDGEDEDEDEFVPEAEGTPLNVGKVVRKSIGNVKSRVLEEAKRKETTSDSMARKRTSDQADVSSGSLSALRAKRQKTVVDSDEDEVNLGESANESAQESAPEDEDDVIVVRSSTERPETPRPALTSDVQVINSPTTSTPPTDPPSSRPPHLAKDDSFAVPSTEREEDYAQANGDVEEDDMPNATMADPLSSSPAPTQTHKLLLDDDLRPPATQVSPEPVVKKRRGRTKPLNTATLQSLLPKRRRQLKPRNRKSEYDFEESDEDPDVPLETSHLDDDEDELGDNILVGKKTKAVATKSRKSAVAKKAKSSTKKTAAGAQKAPKKVQKTYGRRSGHSDKENEGSDFEDAEESTLPEISVSMEDVVKSKELEAAKAKFADIDSWDMDFESMSAEHHRSSSQSWR